MDVYKADFMKRKLWYVVIWTLVFSFPVIADEGKKLLGDESDGSRANFVHRIDMVSEEGDLIRLDDDPVVPFSTKHTCGECHSYDVIEKGWHFNATKKNTPSGRPGQPWILTDAVTATQIPVSYRNWQGTYKPNQIGLSDWNFALSFARHTPGGLSEDMEADPDFNARWMESGELDINCLSCHDAESAHDQSEYPIQIAKQNFRWATAATCGFATVSGSAKSMPDMYDYLMPGVLDDPKLIPPSISYDASRFDEKGRVFVDVVSNVPNERCYFCHSSIDAGSERWSSDEDVHLAAGLDCVDCHLNGIDHNITRGYETESADSDNPLATVSSCRGCHVGDEHSDHPTEGRLGAPKPLHAGIPPVHFDKLACTACHSGPWPKQNTVRSKTSQAHALGAKGSNKSAEALPHIVYPVFAKQTDGKLGPHKIIWPAFWGSLKDNKVVPISAEIINPVISKTHPDRKRLRSGDWMELSDKQISEILLSLKSQGTVKGEAVYIGGGKLHRIDSNGKLIASEHQAGEAYVWPIAHNVRPATQSLGVRSCKDCHSTEQAFMFGNVEVDSPVISQKDHVKKMADFQDIDKTYAWAFAFSFVFRPMLKIVTLGSCAAIAAVLLLYALKVLTCVVKFLSAGKLSENTVENNISEEPCLAIVAIGKKLIYFVAIVSFLVLAVTGFGPLILSKALTGYILMAHATFAPVFSGCLAVMVLFCAHHSRFNARDWSLLKSPCLIKRVCFWLIVILSLPMIISIVLSMFPIFGTHGQECLLCIHRYCAFAFAIVAVVHTLLNLAGSKKANILTED